MENTKLKVSSLSVLFGAHLINDMYANLMPQLTAVLIAAHSLSMEAGATAVAVFAVTANVAQPIFGYFADQKGQRWLVFVGTLWMSLLLGVAGLIPYYPMLLIIAAISGFGTAAFHPQGAAMIGVAGGRFKGLIMSSYMAAGNIGMAASPLILLPLFHNYGIKYTWVIMIPGTITALLLYKYAPQTISKEKGSTSLGQVIADLRKSSVELVKLIAVVVIRSLVHTGLLTLLPVYLLMKGFSAENTSYLMFLTLATGAAGGILGGYLSDRFGRKILIVSSMVLATLAFYGFIFTSGVLSYVLLALGGLALISSFSVTIVIAQEIIPQNAALASGLSIGFAVGIGSMSISFVGKYADVFGIDSAIKLLFIFPLVAAVLALLLKSDTKIGLLKKRAD